MVLNIAASGFVVDGLRGVVIIAIKFAVRRGLEVELFVGGVDLVLLTVELVLRAKEVVVVLGVRIIVVFRLLVILW